MMVALVEAALSFGIFVVALAIVCGGLVLVLKIIGVEDMKVDWGIFTLGMVIGGTFMLMFLYL